jgi:hypothetical protein
MQFRTYMGLIAVGNLYFMLEVFALKNSTRARLLWLAGSGLFLGLTFLVRIDLGILFSMLALGSVCLFPLVEVRSWKERIRFSALVLVGYLVLIVLVHIPADQFAARNGFRKEFWSEYQFWVDDAAKYLKSISFDWMKKPVNPDQSVKRAPNEAAVTTPEGAPRADENYNSDRRTRPRPFISDIVLGTTSGARHFAFLVYYPIAAAGIIILLSVLLLMRGWRTNNSDLVQGGFMLLIATGSALTLLPQYFLFRPDPPHLSEMMCPFVIAAAIAFDKGLLARRIGAPVSGFVGTLYVILASIHGAFYIEYGMKRPSMGSCAIKSRSEVFFQADNGVSGYVPSAKASQYEALYRIIVGHTAPDDYVVCFPYQPTVNFMTNRRSYLYNLYVDNATAPPNFDEQAIGDIEKYKPGAIVIDDYAMNQIPGSRFTVWAARVYRYVKDHYDYAGTELGNEIYLRRKNAS